MNAVFGGFGRGYTELQFIISQRRLMFCNSRKTKIRKLSCSYEASKAVRFQGQACFHDCTCVGHEEMKEASMECSTFDELW